MLLQNACYRFRYEYDLPGFNFSSNSRIHVKIQEISAKSMATFKKKLPVPGHTSPTLLVITNNGCGEGGHNSALCSSRKALWEATVSFGSRAIALVSSFHCVHWNVRMIFVKAFLVFWPHVGAGFRVFYWGLKGTSAVCRWDLEIYRQCTRGVLWLTAG